MSKQFAAKHHVKSVLLSRQTGRGVKAYCARSGQNTKLGKLALIPFSQFLPNPPAKGVVRFADRRLITPVVPKK